MNNVKRVNMLIEIGVIVILSCIFIIGMCNNLRNAANNNINNYSKISRVDMHPLDSLRFKFF